MNVSHASKRLHLASRAAPKRWRRAAAEALAIWLLAVSSGMSAPSGEQDREHLRHGVPAAPTHISGERHGAESEDIPTLAKVWPSTPSIGSYCHALLYYGLGKTDLPLFPTGDSVLKVLTDEETAVRVFGSSPFVRTRRGLRYQLGRVVQPGEAHRDACLATFAALALPLNRPIKLRSGTCTIGDVLSESVANFDWEQEEPAWTAIAYARYLPPRKEWVNRFGEKASFSQLVQKLLQFDPNTQSCAGTHILQALIELDSADYRSSILDAKTRKRLDAHLTGVIQQIVRLQDSDGGWDERWCDSIVARMNFDRFFITGHLTELLCSVQPGRRPPMSVYERAARWLRESLHSQEFKPANIVVCPFTHASKAARLILTAGTTNTASLPRLSVMPMGMMELKQTKTNQ